MNDQNFTFHLDQTPTLPTRRCRFLARISGYTLSYGNYILAFIIFFVSDWFIAIGALLLGFIVFGIVRSKLIQDSIPPSQREYSYSDYAIATWYLSNHTCFTISPPME